MRKKLLLVMTLIFSFAFAAMAQDRVVSGRLTDPDSGEPLPGVNVVVQGTTIGVITDFDGRYSLSVPADATLVFSGVGFETYIMEVGAQSVIDVQLASQELEEVVVTAIGIDREKRELGYGTQTVKADALAQKSEPNVLNVLQGKLAGVEIQAGSGLAGARTQIFIRGISSINGNNQPLFVIDGIPMDNSSFSTSGTLVGGSAYSNRALDLNPNDIESMTVLKGPAAAALYGSRAANGAIMIVSKKGSMNKKMEITVTSSYNVQDVQRLSMPNYQNAFGQGDNYAPNVNGLNSWGPSFNNPLMPRQMPNITPSGAFAAGSNFPTLTDWRAFPNNVNDFFQRGEIMDNGISVAGGGGKTRYIASFNGTNQTGIIPNSGLQRYSFRVAGSTELSNEFSIDASLIYTNTIQTGAQQGNTGASPWFTAPFIPRNFNLMGTPFLDPLVPGVQTQSLLTTNNRDNPRWSVNNNTYNSTVQRATLSASLNYKPSYIPGLSLHYRVGIDQYTDRRLEVIAFGGRPSNSNWVTDFRGGNYYDNYFYRQFNSDVYAIYQKNITDDLNLRLTVGNQITEIELVNQGVLAQAMVIPGFNNLSNFTRANMAPFNSLSKTRLVGVYGTLALSFRNWLFLEFQGRNDWSSTLPSRANSFFYPAVSLGWVFTDALNIKNDILSYGKIRANWARVGNAAGPYLLNTVYAFQGATALGNNVAGVDFPFGGTLPGITLGNRLGSTEAGQFLQPEFKTSFEIGGELGFFNGRLNLDLNYFSTFQNQQIFANIPVGASTGFTSFTGNAAEMTNEGWEIALDGTPIKTNSGFRWDVNFNWYTYRNRVNSLPPGITLIQLAGFTGFGSGVVAGRPYGVFLGNDFLRDEVGRVIINPQTGLPFSTNSDRIIGDPNPDWIAGFTNSFSYKGISLRVLFQYQQGGDFISRQTQIARFRGILSETADRERPFIFAGVSAATDGAGNIIRDAAGNPTGSGNLNNIQITAQDYYGAAGLQNFARYSVFDATALRLREISLGYEFPKKLLEKTPFGSINLSFSARNLWFYAPNSPHADPENNQSGGNVRGFEFNNAPTARQYGVNLRLTF